MANRYSTRADLIDAYLVSALSTNYRVDNVVAMQSGTGPVKYNVLTAFGGFVNDVAASSTGFYGDRQAYIIIGKPTTMVDNTKLTACNQMLDDIVAALRGDIGSPPFGISGMTLFRVESADVGETKKNDLSVRIIVSGLVDETY